MSLSCPCVGGSCTERAGNQVLGLVVRPLERDIKHRTGPWAARPGTAHSRAARAPSQVLAVRPEGLLVGHQEEADRVHDLIEVVGEPVDPLVEVVLVLGDVLDGVAVLTGERVVRKVRAS